MCLNLVAASSAADVRYRVRPLPGLSVGTMYSTPADINQEGFVAGWGDRGSAPIYPFLWTPETNTIQLLGSLASCDRPGAYAYGLSDAGHVVGEDYGLGCFAEGWIWTAVEGIRGIGHLRPAHILSTADDVNVHGHVVGTSSGPGEREGFVWSAAAGMSGVGTLNGSPSSDAFSINNSGWVVGGSGGDAFLWTPDDGIRALGGLNGIAGPRVVGFGYVINDLGEVGGVCLADGQYQLFYWNSSDGVTLCGRLFSTYVTLRINGMNNLGQIVGGEFQEGEYMCPVIWDASGGLRNLRDFVDPCYSQIPPGRLVLEAFGINDSGWITVTRLENRGAVLAPYVPGDLDENGAGNGVVDLQDLAIQLANFSREGDADYAAGDLDCDRDVDLEDLAILLGNFGEALP